MSDQREPTDAEIVGGEYQPYASHPASDLPATTASGATPAPLNRATSDEADKSDTVGTHQFVLAIVSLGTGIPISAIAAESVQPGLLGIAVAWAGIIGVNVAHAVARRRGQD